MNTLLTYRGIEVCKIGPDQLDRFASRMIAKNKDILMCEKEFGFVAEVDDYNVIELKFSEKNDLTKFLLQVL